MKALTLWQPWATLIAIEAKTIETRSWYTNYRGPLAIHAAKQTTEDAVGLCVHEPFFGALIGSGFVRNEKNWTGQEYAQLDTTKMPFGAIVATCELVYCIKIEKARKFYRNALPRMIDGLWLPPDEPELSFGDYTPGRYAWILANVKALPEPIPAKGAQGLWEWILPTEAQP